MSGPQGSITEAPAPPRGGAHATIAATASSTGATREAKFSAIALLALVAATGWAVAIGHLSLEWRLNVQYEYGWAVPALALYLFGLRWADRPATGPRLGAYPTQA